MTTYSEYGTENIPIVQARAMLSQLPEQLSAENRAVALTRHGKPVLAVMPWDLFESIMETMEVMGDAETMAAVRESIEDIREGDLIPLEQVKAELT